MEIGVKIKHPQGNVFILGIPLAKRIVEIGNGRKTESDQSLAPLLGDAPIKVIFGKGGALRYEYTATLDQNGYVVVEDKGTLPLGMYSVTVLATDINGDPLRYKDNLVLQIVDTTSEANYDEGIDYDGYFKFPVLMRGASPSSDNYWQRDLVWERSSNWYSRNN